MLNAVFLFYKELYVAFTLLQLTLKVIIESVRGVSYLGDIAIDDLSMTLSCRSYRGPLPTAPPPTTAIPTPPPCPGFQFKCSNGLCIDTWNVCNYRDDCGDGSDEVNCGMY